MEASLSKLLPSVPKTKVTLKRPLETDGGDSSSDDDDIYTEDDSSLGRQTKALYQSVARQCAADFQSEKREAFKKIQSNISKFSLGKKMCSFVYQNGPLKGKRCKDERNGKNGKYCSAEHKRQVSRRGKKRSRTTVLPSGPTLYIDNKGNAHGEAQPTPEHDELMMRLARLSAKPVVEPSLDTSPEDHQLMMRLASLSGKQLPLPSPSSVPLPPPVTLEDNIADVDIDDLDYSKFVLPPPPPTSSTPVTTTATDDMEIDIESIDDFIEDNDKALRSMGALPPHPT
jgi:hypothetical protein